MAYITKRGSSYGVRYTYQDEQGKNCNKSESFSTKEEATNRKKQIEHELANGTFLISSSVTVAEFLMDWLPKQCSKHKWAPKTYESNLSTIQNLIIPYIGSMEMQKLKAYHMENLYTTLSKTPCGSYIEGKKQELTEKQKQRFLSGTTIHEVHRLLGTAFQYAVEWGILVKSPVPVDSPKKSTQERIIWTVEEMRAALDSMEDPILHLAVHLTLVGTLREGEIVGLTPEDLDFDAADGIGTFRINKSMQRVRKEALNQVDDGCIIKIFPDKLERSTTSLILKSTKTASSCRTIFMTFALKEELKKWLNQLAADERKDPARYHDSGMLFRLPNGLAVEPVLIRKKFLKWQDAHPEFPRIVVSWPAAFQCHLSVDDLRRRCKGRSGNHRTRYGGYAGKHLCSHPAVLPCRTGQEVRGRLLCQVRKPQLAGCTRRRRTDHLYDCSAGTAEECRPRSKGAAPSGSADLMQNLPRISKQFQPMQRIPTKKPIVQKPCIDRAIPDFSGLHNEKERQILRFNALLLVHLQGLEPWAH